MKIFKKQYLAPFALLYMLAFSSNAADFHISPSEKEIQGQPIAVHSVAEALEAVKIYRKQHPGESIRLIFHEGTYRLNETISLSPESSDLSFVSAPGEKVVFDGGRTLKCKERAQINGKDVLVFTVPQEAVANGFLDQLYVNGRRAQVAQIPKSYFAPQHPEKFPPLHNDYRPEDRRVGKEGGSRRAPYH
ncbi:MAG: hypothetical protein MJ016_06315, partial [Victivallaceae bacterium]|nr:hypothetical protein [Victivallaceae bacterium]